MRWMKAANLETYPSFGKVCLLVNTAICYEFSSSCRKAHCDVIPENAKR